MRRKPVRQISAEQFAHPYLEIVREEGRYRFVCGYDEGIVCRFYPEGAKKPVRKEVYALPQKLQKIAGAMHGSSQTPEFAKSRTFNMNQQKNFHGNWGMSERTALHTYQRTAKALRTPRR